MSSSFRLIISRIGIFFALFGVILVAYDGALGADWRFYAKSAFGAYYYDKENISRISIHLFRVQQKLTLNSEATVNLVNELGKEYEKVSEIITLREIDCIQKRSRILELIYCSEEGTVIRREFYKPVGWDSIVPESVDDVLNCAICK